MAEVESIAQAFRQVAIRGGSEVVLVSGEPGFGKTTLVAPRERHEATVDSWGVRVSEIKLGASCAYRPIARRQSRLDMNGQRVRRRPDTTGLSMCRTLPAAD